MSDDLVAAENIRAVDAAAGIPGLDGPHPYEICARCHCRLDYDVDVDEMQSSAVIPMGGAIQCRTCSDYVCSACVSAEKPKTHCRACMSCFGALRKIGAA